jgi:hypothetical protein
MHGSEKEPVPQQESCCLMKDDTVRRLQALEDEFAADAVGEGRDDSFDEFVAEYPALEMRGDAA